MQSKERGFWGSQSNDVPVCIRDSFKKDITGLRNVAGVRSVAKVADTTGT